VRILWLKTELLHPVDKGGKIRTFGMLRELKRDHHITYLTLDEGSPDNRLEKALEYCHKVVRIPHKKPKKFSLRFYLDLFLNLVSPFPYAVRAYRSRAMSQAIRKQVEDGKVDLVVCDFLSPSLNVPPGLGVPTLLFQHNVEAMIWWRHFQVQSNPLKKAFFWMEWRKMARTEEAECRRYDGILAVSEDDAEYFRKTFGIHRVAHVPTGVDVEFFTSTRDQEVNRKELVFTGSMDWLANQDAIDFFLSEVLPLLRERVPGALLTVVGRNPSETLIQRASRDSGLTVTGFVDDVRPYMGRAAVFVVPIRIGGGTRLKIFEAMSMGKPVVSTTVGAEGLPLEPGADIIIEDDPAAMVEALARLLENPEEADALGERGATLVREKFAWRAVADRFSEVCEGMVGEAAL
jgi:glycosyltransferase involved in cell wall biosynthesis